MRCLNCNRDGVETSAVTCPHCGVHLPTLLRDVLPGGTSLNGGKYQVDYALGWGGFGITYRALHTSLEQRVAVKEFYPREQAMRIGDTGQISVRTAQKSSFERCLKRFIREGHILARLNHPNVVRVRDQFEERGTAYLVMDLIEGRTLREVLEDQPGRRFTPERVADVTRQLVGALEVVHEAGVYHLDIKPDNVLLTPAGQAVLIDFGAARQGVSSKSTQAFALEYAAPEVLAGTDVGPESDLFELGMMTHELLTGRRPPSALTRLTRDTWSPADLEEPWRGMLALALRLRPQDRPRSIREWWQAGSVERASAVPETVEQARTQTPPPPPARSSRGLTAGAVAAVLVAAVVAVSAWAYSIVEMRRINNLSATTGGNFNSYASTNTTPALSTNMNAPPLNLSHSPTPTPTPTPRHTTRSAIVYCNADNVVVRGEPGTESVKIDRLDCGDAVSKIDEVGGWYLIEFTSSNGGGSQSGWVYGDFLGEADPCPDSGARRIP